MRKEVIERAEMFAVGCISAEQLKEICVGREYASARCYARMYASEFENYLRGAEKAEQAGLDFEFYHLYSHDYLSVSECLRTLGIA